MCDNKRRRAIDRALLAGDAPLRRIAGDYEVAETTLRRHRATCLASAMVEAGKQEAAADIAQGIDVREQLGRINATAFEILHEARESGDARVALRALDRIERQITLAAKLADLLNDAPSLSVSVQVDNGWPMLRSVILETLADHPTALKAVADRLARLEQSA